MVVSFHRSISLGSYSGLKSQVVGNFCQKIAFFEKNDHLRGNIKNSVPKGFTAIHVLCVNFLKFGRPEIGKVVRCFYLTKKLHRDLAVASARIASKICQGRCRSTGTVHTSSKARLTTVAIRIRIRIQICIRIRIRICDPDRRQMYSFVPWPICQPFFKIS